MKYLTAILLFPSLLFAAERSLPSGELHPKVVTAVYSSPIGEVQVLSEGGGKASAILRKISGTLSVLQEVRGDQWCSEWLEQHSKDIPRNCSYVFYDEALDAYSQISSEELEETNLFQTVRGTLRGKNVAL